MKRFSFFSYSFFIIAAVTISVSCTPAANTSQLENVDPTSAVSELINSRDDLPEMVSVMDDSETDFLEAAAYDVPNSNLFERPFNVVETNIVYLYELDIQTASLGCDDSYCYVEIQLAGVNRDTSQLDGTYSVELDLDIDGRGDYMIVVYPGIASAWTNSTISILEDRNNDVGGATPIRPDLSATGLDGYETTIFTMNLNEDPYFVWVRIPPDAFNVVEIAFKRTLLNGDSDFMWGVWASSGNAPIWEQDLNDFFRDIHADVSLIWFDNFQLAELSALDNTCRMAYGFTPGGQEPGLCPNSP